MELRQAEKIYQLLMRIAEAPQCKDIRMELKKTAAGAKSAGIGGSIGGGLGAIGGALLFGPVGAVVGAAVGAAYGASGGGQYKSIPEILRSASQEDCVRIAEVAKTVAWEHSISLTWTLVEPFVTSEAVRLLKLVMEALDYQKKT